MLVLVEVPFFFLVGEETGETGGLDIFSIYNIIHIIYSELERNESLVNYANFR